MVVHPERIRWLFWLRWKMFARSFTRGAGRVSRIIGTVFLLLFGIPFFGGIAVATFFAYRYLPSPANAEVLFLVLTAIYLLWLILPLFEFSVNEGLDISKLALFPLTRVELMVSLVFSTLLDIPTLGLLFIFAAVVVGWSFSFPLALMALLTMIVFYVQVISVSQLVLALLMRVLQSRRFRDLSIILIALFSSSCYLVQQVIIRAVGSNNIVDALLQARISPYLQWLPPGMAASAIQAAAHGNWGISFAWLGVLLVVSLVFLYLWQSIVERGLTSAQSEGSVRVRRQRAVGAGTLVGEQAVSSMSLLGRIRDSQAFTIMVKDLKYFRRDPQLQAALVSSVMSIVFFIFITFFNSGGGAGATSRSFLGSWLVLLSPAFIFLSLYTFSSNVLGLERQSLTTLFLFPVEPKQILWGKNIVVFILGVVEVIVLVLLSAFTTHAWNYVLPAFAIGFAGIGVVLGCGNFTSVFFPQRMRQMRRGMQTASNLSSEGGCLRAVMSFVALFVTAIVLLPVVMSLILPIIFDKLWIWNLSIPASLVYGAVFYYVVTALVAPRIFDRVPEILDVVAKE